MRTRSLVALSAVALSAPAAIACGPGDDCSVTLTCAPPATGGEGGTPPPAAPAARTKAAPPPTPAAREALAAGEELAGSGKAGLVVRDAPPRFRCID